MQNAIWSLGLASPSDSQHVFGLLKHSLLKLRNQKMCCEKNNGQNTHHSLVFYFSNQYRFPVSFSAGDHEVSLSLKIQETQIETEVCALLIP